jgi:large subunit ribosomal protein L10Ae
VKFQLKKVLCMGVAVGNCGMEEKQIFQNVTNECELPCVAIEEELAERIQLNVYLSAKTRPRFFVLFIDFCVYLQVRCLYLKSTMGKVYRVF